MMSSARSLWRFAADRLSVFRARLLWLGAFRRFICPDRSGVWHPVTTVLTGPLRIFLNHSLGICGVLYLNHQSYRLVTPFIVHHFSGGMVLVALALGRLGTWSLCSGVSALRALCAAVIFPGRFGSPPGPALGHACVSLLWLVSGVRPVWHSAASQLWRSVTTLALSHYSIAQPLFWRSAVRALSHCGTQPLWRSTTLTLSRSGAWRSAALG